MHQETDKTRPLARADRMYADVLAEPAGGTASPAPQVSRRVLFAAAGVTLLAGCGSTSTTAGASPTRSAAPGPTATGTLSPGPSTTPAPPPTPTGPPPLPVQTRPQYYVHAGPKAVALTLDDGPGEYTDEILEILQAHHVTATFCMIGRQIAARASVVREVAAAGHHVTNHTWDHADQSRLTLGKVAAQIARTTEAMTDVGITPTMFRAPYGAWSHTVFEATAAAGLSPLDWSVDPLDWSRPGVGSIVSNITRNTRTGSIILDHDGGGDRSQTVAALRIWLPRLLAEGYRFTTP